jgi:PEP-CTERM motif
MLPSTTHSTPSVTSHGGANYQYDDLYPQTLSTYAILASTGTGAAEKVYALYVDGGGFNFFNIVTTPSYAYVDDRGTFTTSVPEPATWAMMFLGFAALGFAGYRQSHKRAAVPVSA